MATALTYSSLISDMQAYLERGGSLDATVSAQLPRLINLAERGCARDTKIQGLITVLSSTLAVGASTLAKPDGWRETVSMFYGTGQQRSPIYPRSYEYCRAYWPDPTVQGPPLYYADYDYSNWLLTPTPDSAYNFEVNCYVQPPLLDSVNTTNWLTNYAPELLEYRAFWELALFLRADADAQRWQAKYTTALQAINTEDLQKIIDRTTTRIEA